MTKSKPTSLWRRRALSLGAAVLALTCTAAQAPTLAPRTEGAAPQMRLLSQTQYLNSIGAILGEDVAAVAKVRFAPVNRVDGLVSIGAGAAIMTGGALEPLETSARAIATRALEEGRRDFLLPCRPADVNARDNACAAQFLGQVGALLFRRPLTPRELEGVVDSAGAPVGKAGDFYYGLAAALSGLLVAPPFMYIQEQVEPDPARPETWRLTANSKASRLSFLLWDSGPDEVLLAAAGRGELDTAAGRERQIRRMIAAPQLEKGIRAFFTDMLGLEAFDNLAKDPVIYPAFTLKVVNDAREQTLKVIVDHLVTRSGDYRDLFTTRRTFVTPDIGLIYGIPVNGIYKGWASYEFPDGDPRAGLLAQVGFLSQFSHPGRSSATKRGRGLRENLLCHRVPDPPPNVNFALVEDVTAKTARDRLAAHNSEPVCAGCHRITDPMGLALENFDGSGRFRLTENGVAVNASGELDGIKFDDAAGLGRAVRDNPALTSCLVARIYSYGTGHSVQLNEAEWIKYLGGRFAANGYRIPDLLLTIATSDAFYAAKAPDMTTGAN